MHNIPPVFDSNSKVLILGSFPSVKSRKQQFFYGHSQNRFWKVLAKIKLEKIPDTIEEKRDFLLRNNVAVWDVIESCEIKGSADSTIKNVKPNKIEKILNNSAVTKVFTNGKTAHEYYQKYLFKKTQIQDIVLPSTSSANASFSFERLCEIWQQIFK